ncbi:hypothetical protein [Candidatus Epulonipiscium viviparus]|uniref:hypothetical protein n=1 Tax=Candidatus Epulonipiscium viviparus TaxID=420336 RepID=UPI00273805DE|nr:hypothetical protein [Candidatus Epulopiscium viviparus]
MAEKLKTSLAATSLKNASPIESFKIASSATEKFLPSGTPKSAGVSDSSVKKLQSIIKAAGGLSEVSIEKLHAVVEKSIAEGGSQIAAQKLRAILNEKDTANRVTTASAIPETANQVTVMELPKTTSITQQFKPSITLQIQGKSDEEALPIRLSSEFSITTAAQNEFEYIISLASPNLGTASFPIYAPTINNVTISNKFVEGFVLNGEITITDLAGDEFEATVDYCDSMLVISDIDVPAADVITISIPVQFNGRDNC